MDLSCFHGGSWGGKEFDAGVGFGGAGSEPDDADGEHLGALAEGAGGGGAEVEVEEEALGGGQGAGDAELEAGAGHVEGGGGVIASGAGVEELDGAALEDAEAPTAVEREGVMFRMGECPGHGRVIGTNIGLTCEKSVA